MRMGFKAMTTYYPIHQSSLKPPGLKLCAHADTSAAYGVLAALANFFLFQKHPPTHAIFITRLVASCFPRLAG